MVSLESLTWLVSLTSAAIVHLFGGQRILTERLGMTKWASLPITILVSEHIFMGFRALVRSILLRIGSEQTRKERKENYALRKKTSDELEANALSTSRFDVTEKERRKNASINAADPFWVAQVEEGASEQAGIHIIRAARATQHEKNATSRGKAD